jgi:hypothetical protein
MAIEKVIQFACCGVVVAVFSNDQLVMHMGIQITAFDTGFSSVIGSPTRLADINLKQQTDLPLNYHVCMM